jgi:hypothetical protein
MGLFDKIFRRDTEGTDIEVAFGLKQISNITREQALEIPAVSKFRQRRKSLRITACIC